MQDETKQRTPRAPRGIKISPDYYMVPGLEYGWILEVWSMSTPKKGGEPKRKCKQYHYPSIEPMAKKVVELDCSKADSMQELVQMLALAYSSTALYMKTLSSSEESLPAALAGE